jgi:hypothetical protein
MKIYQKENCISVTYFDSPKYLLYEWSKMWVKLEDFKEMHLTALKTIKEKGITSLITDASVVTDIPMDECVEWLGKELIPLLSNAGVKRIITIVSGSALSRIGTKSWQNKVMGIDMYDVKDKSEALKLLV